MKAVEDGLRRLDGVDTIEIDLQLNLVTIRPDPRVEIDLASIPQAVSDSGFKPGEMRIRAAGTIEEREGRTLLRIRGWSRLLPVVTGSSSTGQRSIEARVEISSGEARLHIASLQQASSAPPATVVLAVSGMT